MFIPHRTNPFSPTNLFSKTLAFAWINIFPPKETRKNCWKPDPPILRPSARLLLHAPNSKRHVVLPLTANVCLCILFAKMRVPTLEDRQTDMDTNTSVQTYALQPVPPPAPLTLQRLTRAKMEQMTANFPTIVSWRHPYGRTV